ncbi:unnamed protein product [Lathyrus sativus]|nr:unnamed protein product [Lathyrus sativus]
MQSLLFIWSDLGLTWEVLADGIIPTVTLETPEISLCYDVDFCRLFRPTSPQITQMKCLSVKGTCPQGSFSPLTKATKD